MLVKWTLVAFGIAAILLFVLSKILAFMNPPRPERPRPPLLTRVERALRWTVIIPFALAVVLLVLALTGSP
jgi:cytochrome b561